MLRLSTDLLDNRACWKESDGQLFLRLAVLATLRSPVAQTSLDLFGLFHPSEAS